MLELSPHRAQARLTAGPVGPTAQVVVLGMHRSGTSALTGLLRLMGLWAGEEGDFPGADEHNQAGYWEHRDVVWSIDEPILQALGATWCEVANLDLSRLDEGLRARFRERARELVRDLDRHGSWVIKDPRLCLLFPFWREILEHPFCVLIYREPLPVARSLAAREGFPLPFSIALWERYTREALASTRGLPRILISHRELIADPAATLRRLHGHLVRLDSPELAHLHVPTAEEIRAALNPALVHHQREPEIERSYLTPPQLELLDALADGSALDLDPVPPLSAGARDLLAAYQSQQATTRGLLAAHQSLETTTRGLLAAHQSLEATTHDLRAAHQSLEATTRDLREQLTAQTNKTAGLQQGLERLLAAHQRALTWLDELDAIVSAILDSRSWKIGRAITATRRLVGRSQISATERRDRLMAEVRSRRRSDAGE